MRPATEKPSGVHRAALARGLLRGEGMRSGSMRAAIVGWALSGAVACGGAGDPVVDEPDAGSDEGGSEGSTGDGSSDGAAIDPLAPTYFADVKPILDARCVACHGEGGVAPFSLADYQGADSMAEAALVAVDSGAMPPFPASAECSAYRHDPRLLPEERDALEAWIEAGKPEGDPADEGAALPIARDELPRVDLELPMAETHQPAPPSGEIDEHRCFLLDWPHDTDMFA